MRLGFVLLLGMVLAAGLGALDWETAGFRVVTSDGARRLAVERQPVPLPDVTLIDQDGRPFSLRDYRGKTVLVELIYTSCPTLCGALGDEFQSLRALLTRHGADRQAALLSISFDRQNDGPAALKLYGDRYDAAPPFWRVAVPANEPGLTALLHTFGVTVIPDGLGGFVHDGAVYLVDPQGRLTRILDPDTPPQALAAVLHAAAS